MNQARDIKVGQTFYVSYADGSSKGGKVTHIRKSRRYEGFLQIQFNDTSAVGYGQVDLRPNAIVTVQ